MCFVVVGNKCDMEPEYFLPHADAKSHTKKEPNSPKITTSSSSRSPPRLPTRSRIASRRTLNCCLTKSKKASSTWTARYCLLNSAPRHKERQRDRSPRQTGHLQRFQQTRKETLLLIDSTYQSIYAVIYTIFLKIRSMITSWEC
jgi:hypothetical protein